MTTLTMLCSFTSPPLRSNDRGGWRTREDRRKAIRHEASVRALNLRSRSGHSWPLAGPLGVRMTWVVTDARRRDVGASAPTLKAWIDGLVDGGVLAGDHWHVVAEESFRIERGPWPVVRVDIYPFEGVA
jgi:hypothetical protein